LGWVFSLLQDPAPIVKQMILSVLQHPQIAKYASASSPQWDAEYRELRVGRRVVKEYRVPCPNQEAILAAFQEEGWPHHIHDPLPPLGDIEPKCRLHDTIKRLNRHHKEWLIRFHGDGTGEGVCWEYVEAAVLAMPISAGPKRTLHRAA
jgi:hypothetical protein